MPGSGNLTALITGASSGLGAEFARQLATRGYSLVLIARRENRLMQLASDLSNRAGISVDIIPADLATQSGIDQVVDKIHSLSSLDLLVNDAGFGTVGKFYQVDPAKEHAMLFVHVLAPVSLTRAALPCMVANKAGAIINVSSIAGLIPIRNVLYGSTKAFLIDFSMILDNELVDTGVRVQALCPGYVITEFHDTPEYVNFSRTNLPPFLWVSAPQVVSESLSSLDKNKVICIPGDFYKFVGLLARNSLTSGIIAFAARSFFRIRSRATK